MRAHVLPAASAPRGFEVRYLRAHAVRGRGVSALRASRREFAPEWEAEKGVLLIDVGSLWRWPLSVDDVRSGVLRGQPGSGASPPSAGSSAARATATLLLS